MSMCCKKNLKQAANCHLFLRQKRYRSSVDFIINGLMVVRKKLLYCLERDCPYEKTRRLFVKHMKDLGKMISTSRWGRELCIECITQIHKRCQRVNDFSDNVRLA